MLFGKRHDCLSILVTLFLKQLTCNAKTELHDEASLTWTGLGVCNSTSRVFDELQSRCSGCSTRMMKPQHRINSMRPLAGQPELRRVLKGFIKIVTYGHG